MKTLRLQVRDQILDYTPNFSVDGLYPGMKEPVRLEFDFSEPWKSMVKVAAFYSPLGNEYPPIALKDGKSCIIPEEALAKTSFKVQILGKRDGEPVFTTKCTVYLKGGIA